MRTTRFEALLFGALTLFSTVGSAQAQKKPAPTPTAERDPLAWNDHMVELGLFAGLGIISSRHELYDPTVAIHQPIGNVAPELGLRAAYFPIPYVGLEFEGALAPTSTKRSSEGYMLLAARGQVVGQYPIGRFAPFAVMGMGTLIGNSADEALGSDADLAFHWGLGGKYFAHKNFTLRLDARHIVSGGVDPIDSPDDDPSANHFEVLFGVSFVLGREGEEDPDPDGDGVRGDQDKCPSEKGLPPDGCPAKDQDNDQVPDDRDACVDEPGEGPDGCPLEDSDGDGVPDQDDACPDAAANTPDGCPPRDRDKDGVTDASDECPDESGPAPSGCPDPDPDGDGIPTVRDRCPTEPGPEPSGCPTRDTDDDGVSDELDQCPAEPETKNGFEDEDGCPDELPEAVKKFTGKIKGITFKAGSAEIEKSSFDILNQAAKVLLEFTNLRMEVQGHTDTSGKLEVNLELSQQRADAVRAYLLAQGVGPTRVEAKGLGPNHPIADNNTAAGRAENRRIEFVLIP